MDHYITHININVFTSAVITAGDKSSTDNFLMPLALLIFYTNQPFTAFIKKLTELHIDFQLILEQTR